MSWVLLWSAISRVATQHSSAWRAVVAVMLLGLTVVAGCDVRPFCEVEGSCSSDGTDDGGEEGTIALTATPEEIDANVGDVVTVQVRVVNPVADRTYSFNITEQPIRNGQIDNQSIETDNRVGIMSFRFEASAQPSISIENIEISVTDSASEEGSLEISVEVGPDTDLSR